MNPTIAQTKQRSYTFLGSSSVLCSCVGCHYGLGPPTWFLLGSAVSVPGTWPLCSCYHTSCCKTVVRELGQYLAVDLLTFLCGLMDERSMMTPKVVINGIAWQVPIRCPFHCGSEFKHGSGLCIPGNFLRARFPTNPKIGLSIEVSLSLFSSPAASTNLNDPDPLALLLASAF